MLNVGEQLVSSYLRHKRDCDFIETSIPLTPQGDIDVIGLNRAEKKAYVCEVTIQLTDGLLFSTRGRSDTVARLTNKFAKDIDYVQTHLPEYKPHLMYWCPIVNPNRSERGRPQPELLAEVQANIRHQYDVEIECIVNQQFKDCINELKAYARCKKTQLQCPLMRFMQIEQHLAKHLDKLD